jgi:hypothetical protein
MAEDRRKRITLGIRAVGVVVMFLVAVASAPRTANADECPDFHITCSTQTACISVAGNSCGCEGMVWCRSNPSECPEESGHPIETYCREDFPE